MAKRDPNHLTPEKDGRFCKRVRGRLYHFGSNGDKDIAMREWLAVKDDLLSGRKIRPRMTARGPMTIKLIRDHFLNACTDKVNAKPAPTMKGGTFDDYYRACDEFAAFVGADRDPSDLTPPDFAAVRSAWSARMGPWSLDRYVQAVRTMFNHADTHRLIDRLPFYGKSFSKSTEADKRRTDRKAKAERGERAFTDQEVRIILEAAIDRPVLLAMILLALNGGMYAKDIAELRTHHLQRDAGEWLIDYDRGKTDGIPWNFALWPETKTAIDAARSKSRREPRDAADADRLFLTIHGRPFHREHIERDGSLIVGSSSVDLIAQEFDKLLCGLWILEGETWRPIKRDGVGFGSFRHTHISKTGDHPDSRAADRVTGHKVVGVKRHYDKVPVFRLKAITDLARERLPVSSSIRPASDTPAAPSPTNVVSPVPDGSRRVVSRP